MARFREIERLRGLAIVLALFNHAPLHPLVPWFCGVVGVHLFFVISGFVITLSLLRLRDQSEKPLATFYTRRAFRLLPLALTSIALALCAATWLNWSGKSWSSPSLVLHQAVAALTLNYNYRTFTTGWDLIYFWSLNVEEHFYLALPFLLFAIPNRGKILAALATAWIAATAVRYATAPDSYEIVSFWSNHFSTHARLDLLIAGVLLALVHEARIFERPSSSLEMRVAGTLVAGGATLGLVFVHRVFPWLSQNGWTFVELCSVALVALASFRRGYVLAIPGARAVFEWLGSRAYAIYLLHMPLWRIEFELLGRAPWVRDTLGDWGAIALYVPIVAVTAELAYRVIERPLTALGRKQKPKLPHAAPTEQKAAA